MSKIEIGWPTAVVAAVIVAALATVALAGGALGLDTEARMEALTILGGLGSLLLAAMRQLVSRRDGGDPPDVGAGVGLLVVAAACSAVAASGCGRGALAVHARAAIVTGSVLEVAGEEVDAARARALDRVEAEYPTDPEHDRELDREAARWRPAGQGLDAARETLASWVRSIDLARIADDGDAWLAPTLGVVQRLVALYGRIAALARELGADVPPLPPVVSGLLGGAL